MHYEVNFVTINLQIFFFINLENDRNPYLCKYRSICIQKEHMTNFYLQICLESIVKFLKSNNGVAT